MRPRVCRLVPVSCRAGVEGRGHAVRPIGALHAMLAPGPRFTVLWGTWCNVVEGEALKYQWWRVENEKLLLRLWCARRMFDLISAMKQMWTVAAQYLWHYTLNRYRDFCGKLIRNVIQIKYKQFLNLSIRDLKKNIFCVKFMGPIVCLQNDALCPCMMDGCGYIFNVTLF